jgi:flagellar biosynthetic protein FliR
MFNFSQEELLTFFAVLVRYSTLVAVLPFTGDRTIPTPVKILFSLALTIALFPALVTRGAVNPGEAVVWGATTGGIVGTIALEAMFGLVLGYTAKLLFDAIQVGSSFMANFMGFTMASTYDPHQETQSTVLTEFQMALAMLVFLVLDGHHLMLRAALDSYRVVGLGKAGFGGMLSERLIDFTSQVFRFGIQIAAPVAVSMFAVYVAFGVIAKAVPQMNILVLSFAISIGVGFFVLLLTIPEFQSVAGSILGRMEEWMNASIAAMAAR